jgi:hypothetical protein
MIKRRQAAHLQRPNDRALKHAVAVTDFIGSREAYS